MEGYFYNVNELKLMKTSLTSISGTAEGMHGGSSWLLTLATAVSVSDCWFWGALVFFPSLNVFVDTRGLAGAER